MQQILRPTIVRIAVHERARSFHRHDVRQDGMGDSPLRTGAAKPPVAGWRAVARVSELQPSLMREHGLVGRRKCPDQQLGAETAAGGREPRDPPIPLARPSKGQKRSL